MGQGLVVRGVWLRNIVVVFAIGVELHTSAAGQAAAALDLSRLAGLASEGRLACVLVGNVSHALHGSNGAGCPYNAEEDRPCDAGVSLSLPGALLSLTAPCVMSLRSLLTGHY